MAGKTLIAPGFIKHLEVLRSKALSVMAVIAALTVACFVFITPLIKIIQMPVSGMKNSLFT